jgi:hypothetical protein
MTRPRPQPTPWVGGVLVVGRLIDTAGSQNGKPLGSIEQASSPALVDDAVERRL